MALPNLGMELRRDATFGVCARRTGNPISRGGYFRSSPGAIKNPIKINENRATVETSDIHIYFFWTFITISL